MPLPLLFGSFLVDDDDDDDEEEEEERRRALHTDGRSKKDEGTDTQTQVAVSSSSRLTSCDVAVVAVA